MKTKSSRELFGIKFSKGHLHRTILKIKGQIKTKAALLISHAGLPAAKQTTLSEFVLL